MSACRLCSVISAKRILDEGPLAEAEESNLRRAAGGLGFRRRGRSPLATSHRAKPLSGGDLEGRRLGVRGGIGSPRHGLLTVGIGRLPTQQYGRPATAGLVEPRQKIANSRLLGYGAAVGLVVVVGNSMSDISVVQSAQHRDREGATIGPRLACKDPSSPTKLRPIRSCSPNV